MGRWEPDARDRLQAAAFALYAERGFDTTTVAEIAARAGLTERTFFRHFADKREVLFAGAAELQERLVAAVDAAPDSAGPLEAVAAGLLAACEQFQGQRDGACRRHLVLAANVELKERELVKLASLAVALAQALRCRDVPGPVASLAAEAGVAVFRVAFERWVTEPDPPELARLFRDSLDELKAVAAG